MAGAQLVDDGAQLDVAEADGIGQVGDAVRDAVHAAGVEQQLARRRQDQVDERAAGLLRLGVEEADGLDVVAKELDADRLVVERAPDVDHAAAHAECAGVFDDRDALVASLDQLLGQLDAVELAADRRHHRMRVERLGRERAPEQRLGRQDHRGEAEFVVQTPARGDALPRERTQRRDLLVGALVVGLEGQHRRQARPLLGLVGEQALDHARHALHVGHHDEQGPTEAVAQRREHEGDDATLGRREHGLLAALLELNEEAFEVERARCWGRGRHGARRVDVPGAGGNAPAVDRLCGTAHGGGVERSGRAGERRRCA